MTAKNINRWHGVGVVVGDPEVRELLNNRSVAIAQIKIIEHVKDIEIVEVIRLVAFNNLAKHLATHAKAGIIVSAHGRLKTVDRGGFEIRLTEPIGLEVRNCEECKTEFFVRDRGQRHCPEHQRPWLGSKDRPPAKEEPTTEPPASPLTPRFF
jgi:hypothetical protein